MHRARRARAEYFQSSAALNKSASVQKSTATRYVLINKTIEIYPQEQ